MLNSGNKFSALDDKKRNILTLVLSEKKILNETNNHNHHPPCKLNGWTLKVIHVQYCKYWRNTYHHKHIIA